MRAWLIVKWLRSVVEQVAKIGKEMTTNENGLGVELELKIFKV